MQYNTYKAHTYTNMGENTKSSKIQEKRYTVDFTDQKKILKGAMISDAHFHPEEETKTNIAKYIKEDIIRPFIEFRLRYAEINEAPPTLKQVLENIEI